MDLPLSSPSFPELDSRAITGWAALEQGNIEEARAVLQDVYTANPAHPALPLLAAGIRRARPRQIPWRGIILLTGLLVAGTLAWHSSRASRTLSGSDSATASAAVRAQQDPPIASNAMPNATPVGTAGRGGPTSAIVSPPQPIHPVVTDTHAVLNDEVQIRQAITRFAVAYSSRWTPLVFQSCDISRSDDTASVACQSQSTPGSPEGAAEGAWVFACRKTGDAWKIVRMQPPADVPPE